MTFEAAIRARFGSKYRRSRGRNGVEFKVCCPFCVRNGKSIDKSYKMYINPTHRGGVYNCYRCSASGTVGELLGKISGDEVVIQKKEAPLPTNVSPPGHMVDLQQLEVDHPAIAYLTRRRSRPFDPAYMAHYFGVKYCAVGQRFGNGVDFLFDTTNTLIFPVYMFGALVGWQARMLDEPETLTDEFLEMKGFPRNESGGWVLPPKYYTSPGFPKGRVICNFDLARQHEIGVVSEGTFDVAAIGTPGMATLGKGITEYQARLLKTYFNKIVVALDPDASKESRAIVANLRMSIDVYELELNDQDPGDMLTDDIWKTISAGLERQRLVKQTYNLPTSVYN